MGATSGGGGARAGAGGPGTWPSQVSMCGLFSIEFYRPYFDVDTCQVKRRLLQAVWPRQSGTPFLSDEEDPSGLPDLYGPVWVSATLVFELAVVANASRQAGASEFDDVFRSVYFVLFYLLVGALGLWVFFKMHDAALSAPEAISVYGYSLTSFVVTAPLCLIGYLIRWLSLGAASACAALFVFRSSWPRLKDKTPDKSTMVFVGAVVVYHFLWFVFIALS
ncbi:unnamed protein product [Sphacelaria rigidula]